MANMEALAEQTAFLLSKQQEVLEFYKEKFESLFSALEAGQKKAEQVNAGPELASFQKVSSMISEYEKESVTHLEKDIEFLSEQLSAIKQIADLGDKDKAEELTKMLIEDEGELTDTNRFKADVEQEVEEAKEGFASMIDDIQNTLLEDGICELEKLLEAHVESASSQCCGEEDDECESSCHDCSGCNIFQALEENLGESTEEDSEEPKVCESSDSKDGN